jgi:hypothetical protein
MNNERRHDATRSIAGDKRTRFAAARRWWAGLWLGLMMPRQLQLQIMASSPTYSYNFYTGIYHFIEWEWYVLFILVHSFI